MGIGGYTPIRKAADQAAGLANLDNHKGTAFDSGKHIVFEEPPKILMMKDIGFAEDVGVSPVAVTHPFQLFSPEAIHIMRTEIAQAEVRQRCMYSSNLANAQLRGYARKYAPFTYAAWTHPDTVAIVSKLAGIDLVPVSDYEIAHINLSTTKTEEEAKAELDQFEQGRARKLSLDSGINMSGEDENKPVVGWHTDSYPFVCVLMMSDCTDMIGGETAICTASGDVLRVRGPTMGCAVILQGRYITHQALQALGAKERITAVTSWRPRSPFVKDDSELRTVRPVSNLGELYPSFIDYRLDIVEQRIRQHREHLAHGQPFDTRENKRFLQELADLMIHTNNEIVEESKVTPGFIETVDVPNVIV